jgi:hypothetical protein
MDFTEGLNVPGRFQFQKNSSDVFYFGKDKRPVTEDSLITEPSAVAPDAAFNVAKTRSGALLSTGLNLASGATALGSVLCSKAFNSRL